MTRVAFIGLGNMGSGMAANQAKAGRDVVAFDLSAEAMNARQGAGHDARRQRRARPCKDADIVITMLPAGQHVRDVYAEAILPNAPKDALLIDCSTIDVDSARTVARDASMQGFRAADAPVSGGTAAATAGTLTFMVGCREQDFPEFEEALKPMAQGHHPRRRFRRGAGGQDLQQHAARHFHDRHVRGLRAGRDARASTRRSSSTSPRKPPANAGRSPRTVPGPARCPRRRRTATTKAASPRR